MFFGLVYLFLVLQFFWFVFDYSYFLLLNRESWIDSYNSSVEGRKILKELWTLQQTGADLEAVHAFQKRKEGA